MLESFGLHLTVVPEKQMRSSGLIFKYLAVPGAPAATSDHGCNHALVTPTVFRRQDRVREAFFQYPRKDSSLRRKEPSLREETLVS